jgi:hypothetical protein
MSTNLDMTTVFGLYNGRLLPHRLGGLCRGREWWVEGPFLKGKQPLSRMILSAGQFANQDINHTESRLGLDFVEISIPELLAHILRDRRVIAIVEDGPVAVQENVWGRETYTLSRMGLSAGAGFARWEQECSTVEDFASALQHGALAFVIDPEERLETDVWEPGTPVDFEDLQRPPLLSEDLRRDVHWLVGSKNYRNDDHRYVPQALWEVTEHCAGVLVLHADRDGECIAIYSKEPFEISEVLQSLSSIEAGREFLITCTVPTMMLRWKRALFEFCDELEPDCPPELRALVPIEEESIEDVEGDSTDDESDSTEEDSDSVDETSED